MPSPMTESLVNTTTVGDQDWAFATGLSDGGWVVTWSQEIDPDERGVYQQRFDRNGLAVGSESLINTTMEGDRNFVTSLSDGGWLATWLYDGQFYQQRFNADGTPHGTTSAITAGENHLSNAVVQLADGGWISTSGTSFPTMDIYQTRYDQFGVQVGEAVLVSDTGWSNFSYTAALPDGGWVVTWSQDLESVWQIRYDADGNGSIAEQINTTEAEFIGDSPITTLADGGWVVAWSATDGDVDTIRLQRFGADGGRIGAEKIATTDGPLPGVIGIGGFSLAALKDGGWIVTWLLNVEGTSESGPGRIMYQRFDAEGDKVGGEMAVSSYPEIETSYPSVTALGDGGWLISWTATGADGDGDGIYQARYTADGEEIIGVLPEAANKTVMLLEDVAHVFAGSDFGFADGDGDLLHHVTITTLPASGVLTFDGGAVAAGLQISATDLSRLVWTPDENSNGVGIAGIGFAVTDTAGARSLDEYAITFDVAAVNDAPVGADTVIVMAEDSAHQFQLSDFVFDDVEGHALAFIEVYVPTLTGSLTLNGVTVEYLQVIAAEDISALVWTPDENAFGDQLDLLSYRIIDEGGTANGGDDSDDSLRAIRFRVEDVVDVFKGTNGKDTLTGTDGHDVLRGRRGNDIMTGGGGEDHFIIEKYSGKDRILDFDAVSSDGDVLDLSKVSAINNWRDLKRNHMDERGDNVVIDLGRGARVTLTDVDIGDLDRGDFLF